MAKSKETKINNTLKRHTESVNEKLGASIVNDFLQLGKILDNLKENDQSAYNAFYALIKENMEVKEINKERGTKIQVLTRKVNNLEKDNKVYLNKNKKLQEELTKYKPN